MGHEQIPAAQLPADLTGLFFLGFTAGGKPDCMGHVMGKRQEGQTYLVEWMSYDGVTQAEEQLLEPAALAGVTWYRVTPDPAEALARVNAKRKAEGKEPWPSWSKTQE